MDQHIEKSVVQPPAVSGGSVQTNVTVNVVNGRTYNPVTSLVVFLALLSIPILPYVFAIGLVLSIYIVPVVIILWGIKAIYNRLQD